MNIETLLIDLRSVAATPAPALCAPEIAQAAADEIERLTDEIGGIAMAAEQFGRQAESAKCKAEIERLRAAIMAIEAQHDRTGEMEYDSVISTAVSLVQQQRGSK